MTDWFQQSVARLNALQKYRMGLLQQTQDSLAQRGIGGNSAYSPQAVAIHAMLTSRYPAVAPVAAPNTTQLPSYVPDWAPDWLKKAGNSEVGRYIQTVYGGPNLLGKFAGTSPGKAVFDILSRGNYASADVAKAAAKGDVTGIPNAFWQGLSGQDKSTYADVINQVDPNAPPWVKGGLGLAGDIALDPTTYIGGGLISKLGKLGKAGKAAEAGKALETTTASKQWALTPEQLRALTEPKAIEGPKRGNRLFVGSPSGDIKITAPDVLRTAQAQSLTSQIQDMPALLHPSGMSVSPLFKDVTTTTTREAPRIIQGEIVQPPAKLSKLRAIKLAVMQSPEHTISGFKVSDILRTAKNTTDPSKLKMVQTLINQEAKRIYKTGDYSGLEQIGGKPGSKLYTKAGEKAQVGLTIHQITNLLHTGEVGPTLPAYSKATDALTNPFPIWGKEDLQTFHVLNDKGQLVNLDKYLTDLGITPKASEAGFPTVEPFKLPSEKAAPSVETITSTKSKRLNPAETISWMSQHAGMLSPAEMAYLRRAGSRASFEKRLAELKTKVVAGNFKTLNDVISAAEQGLIPKEALQKLLDTAGASSLKDLRSKATDILNKTGPRPVAAEKPPVEVPKPGPKLERLSGDAAKQADPFAITPAEKLIATGVPDKIVPQLDAAQVKDLAHALGYATMENIVRPLDPLKYPWVTDIKKALRTHRTPGVGRARNLHGWNAFSQSDVFRTLVNRASSDYRSAIAAAKNKPKAVQRAVWKARAGFMYDRIVPELRAVDILLRNKGVKMIAGTDNAGLLVSLSDVIDALPRPLVERYLFTPASSVYPTDFLNAAASIAKSIIDGTSLDVARADAYNAILNGQYVTKMKKPEVFASNVVSDLMDHSDDIIKRVEENYARESLKTGTDVVSMTDPVIKQLATEFADPNVSMGRAFGDFAGRAAEVAANGRTIGAAAGTTRLANDLVDAKLAGTVTPSDMAEARAAREFASKPGDATVARNQFEARKAIAPNEVDLGEKIGNELASALFKANVPMDEKIVAFKDAMGQAFLAHYGHADLHAMLQQSRTVTQDFSRSYSYLMSQIWKTANGIDAVDTPAKLQEAFRALQSGLDTTGMDIAPVAASMQQAVDVLFGHAAKNGLGTFFQRNGFTVDHLNKTLEYFGVPEAYHFNPNLSIMDQADIWKTWPTEDILNNLDKVHAAVQRAAVDTTVGSSFSSYFGSKVSGPGMVKVADPMGKSYLAPFIDKSLYYPREIVDQLKYLDKTMRGSLTVNRFHNATVNAVVHHILDPVIHMWKSGLTIWRPGHHVSNLIGDVMLSWFQGVNNPAVYKTAARIMTGRRAAYTESWDGLKALMNGSALDQQAARGKGIYTKINGKKTFVSDDQLWRAAWSHGNLPEFRTLEDVAFNQRQATGMNVSNNPIMQAGRFGQRKLGGLSQVRDHWVRVAHFVDVMQKGNFKTLDEGFAKAAATVRKWHPDGSDLSNFESKYMRRWFMFYSWQRKAIPLALETALMHPGKAMVLPKAMYNFAITMGLNPESLTNPFPNDQMFPDFLTDSPFGPQWQGSLPGVPGTGLPGGVHYRGINPPDPVSQILSQYGGNNPAGQVLGAMNPFARIPYELATGVNVRTSRPINSKLDYVDQQIPGVSYLDKVTGRTLGGLGPPVRNVQRANIQPGYNSEAFFNWLTGLGQVDYSQPNYIKTAEYNLRDKLRGN